MSTAEVVATGLILVFSILLLITGILYIFPYVLRLLGASGTKKTVKTEPEQDKPEAEGPAPELIIAIMAAIAADQDAEGVPYGNFRIASFRRLGSGNR